MQIFKQLNKFSRILLTALVIALMELFNTLPAPGAEQRAGDRKELEKERLPAEEIVELAPQKACFQILQGKHEGKLVPMNLDCISEEENKWVLYFKDLYRLRIWLAPSSAVVVKKLEIFSNKKKIDFCPPFNLVPEEFVAGRKVRKSGKVSVFDMETGKKVDSGHYCQVINSLSRTTFDIPAGKKKGYLLEYEFYIDLSYSYIQIDLETGWSMEKRPVYWRTKTTLKKFGIFSETSIHCLAKEACEE